ncbi:MAG: hypothetical protein N2234_01140 [Planctomycetota bacterium]|nr:hypothetical protein [Planctomycetota bacterium]
MKWVALICGVFVLAAILFLVADVLYASGDKDKPSAPTERVDLPVEKPTKPAGDRGGGDNEGGGGDDDEGDDDEEPPVEFFDKEIKANKVFYVMDKTGSMNGPVGHPITDEKGNVINNPTKMQHIKAEFCKSVMALGENAKFSGLFYSAYPNWAHSSTYVADDITVFRMTLVKATPENKAAAIAWANGVSAMGATPILQALMKAFEVPEVEVILLHTDGVANVVDDYCYCDNGWCGRNPTCNKYCCDVTVQRAVPIAKQKKIKIHSFAHAISSFYPPATAAIGEAFLKEIAAQTGGEFTKVN